jgi:hypothetical protein
MLKVVQFVLTLAPNNPEALVSSIGLRCFGITICEIKFEQLKGKILLQVVYILL